MSLSWFLDKRGYKETYSNWNDVYSSLSDDLIHDIAILSKKIEDIFDYRYFKKYNSPFMEDIIWIASQARISKDSKIHKCVNTFTKEVSKVINNKDHGTLSDEYFHQKVNTIIAITIENLKKYNSINPSLYNCVSPEEFIKIKNKLIYFAENESLNERASSIYESTQMKLIKKYIKSANIQELESKIKILLDIATSESENSPIASASINYLLDSNDVIEDKIGILGLVDDMVAIEYGIKKIQPNNTYFRLINEHNKNYPSFDLPLIDTSTPISLINVENIVKASYTKISEEPIKRLLIVPEIGPLHILSAVGKAICNRIDSSMFTTDYISFNKGEKILIGEIEASSYGKTYQKKIIVEYDQQCGRAPHLFYVKTSKGDRQTVSKEIIKDASLSIDSSKLSSNNDLNKFKREDRSNYIPWGSMEFNKSIKSINAHKKIFIFCKKNNLEKYLSEEVFGQTLKSWFGLRYFDNKFKFQDHIGAHSLFPEPFFYSASNKDIAMEMIRNKWEDNSVGKEPDLIIINEPSWLQDDIFLKILKRTEYNVLVFNDFFRKTNKTIKENGFEEIAVKPDTFVPVKKSKNNLSQSLIEKYLLKSEPFSIKTKPIAESVLDKITTEFKNTKILEKEENFFIKCTISRVLQAIRSRITPHTKDSYKKLSSELTKIAEELSFLANINNEFLKLSKLILENMKPLLEINRSKEILNCLKDLKLNKKTILVVMPAQLENARKFFADGNKNFEIILASNLENQNDVENLIVPYFLGGEYSTMLRNFKYANNHIFLLSKSEEKVHNSLQKRDKNLFDSYFSDKKKYVKSKEISNENIENEISYLDPSANIFQQSINIVSNQTGSGHDLENIESRMFSLESDQTLVLPSGGDTLMIEKDNNNNTPELAKVSTINVGDRLIIPESFSGGDILEAVVKSDEEQHKEYEKILKKASSWQKVLLNYKNNNNLNMIDLNSKLEKIGIKRNIATIRSWLNDPSTIAPRNREEIIPKIFSLDDSSFNASKSCLKAVSKIYSARSEARKILVSNVENKSIENNQSTLKIDINATRFNFNIIEVRSVADVNVQFKHLYHLRSYEELKEINS